jgi:hypothetical protein
MKWQVECAKDASFKRIVYSKGDIEFNVHCPDKAFDEGVYYWRYRGIDKGGQSTNWSTVRRFVIEKGASVMPMPSKEELISRIPKGHPRLFVRPEKTDELRRLRFGRLKDKYDELVGDCEGLLRRPPSTKEPDKYSEDMVRGGDPWRALWWGNRTYTIKALNGAATLGFTYLLDGNRKYGLEAKRILMECAKWDPLGSTGYRYNDEAGMPYNYYFSRTYTFINDLLSEDEKKICRDVMTVRGRQMYEHLCPSHLWRPYASHSNRAWHFLGEIGVAFAGEIEDADAWVWFAMNVFYNTYPVWCDDDGGWHEGTSYWSSYQMRFTWWADIMREAFGINAFDKPYYSKAGYYAMYLMPPGKVGGGFGDLTAKRTARDNRELMSILAAQAQNGCWRWYVDTLGGPVDTGGYVGYIRGALPDVQAKEPDDLPSSRLFEGTGQAYLNSNLKDAGDGVQVVFKSSPFGTQSHGYESNNSFLLWGYGERLLIRSGYRDSYGSDHHKEWMWSTRSVNSITVNGKGQNGHSAGAQGKITGFATTDSIDIVVGEAGGAYEGDMERFTRAIVFVKPELVIVYDRLAADKPSSFEYWLHALKQIEVDGQHNVKVQSGDVVCDIDIVSPQGLTFTQTNQYDPNPRPRITLREWHLTATTADRKKRQEFIAVYRVHRAKDGIPKETLAEEAEGGYALRAKTSMGDVTVLLPKEDKVKMNAGGLVSDGGIVVRLDRDGGKSETVRVD